MQSDSQRLKERLSRVKPDPIDPRKAFIFGFGATIGVIVGIILIYAYAEDIDAYMTFRRQRYLAGILIGLMAFFGVRWFLKVIKS